jgi:hypothetical protein
MSKLTGETLTDAQIQELQAWAQDTGITGEFVTAQEIRLCCLSALTAPMGSLRRANARARCAELLNARIARTAQRVSPFERDHQCEHLDGTVQCERLAAAWTISNGSGYIVGCKEHAQELLDEAVAEGNIYDLTVEGRTS